MVLHQDLDGVEKYDGADNVAAKDDADAIDKNNIIGGRTRGAQPRGGYKEPGDDEGLPGTGDSGASSVA